MNAHPRIAAVLFLGGLSLAASSFLPMHSVAEAQVLRAKFEPPDGKVLLIVGQDKTSIDAYVNAINIVPGGTMVYTSVQNTEGLAAPYDGGGGLHHGQYLVDQYPNTVIQVGLWMVDALGDVSSGALDGNIDAIGAWIKNSGRPVFLRIGYEFDYPANHYGPAAYVQAYRHIVDRLRNNNVANVAFVWHSYANLPEHPLSDWYPGDDYVDWVGMSVFGPPNVYMTQLADLARQHQKPLMIAEATPFGTGTLQGDTSWTNWFAPFFQFVADNGVKAVSYIDYDWESYPMFQGQGWGDARVQANDIVKGRWLQEIGQDKYLQSSPDLYQQLGVPAAPANLRIEGM